MPPRAEKRSSGRLGPFGRYTQPSASPGGLLIGELSLRVKATPLIMIEAFVQFRRASQPLPLLHPENVGNNACSPPRLFLRSCYLASEGICFWREAMGKNSRIEWTDHTFNPWWGCTKVSEACKHCYAESWSKRVGQKVWGPLADRRFFSDRHWLEPFKWNAEAEKDGVRLRVFCASMADVFENRPDLDVWRHKLWDLIEATPQLDWLLLTKRPELVKTYSRWANNWPNNVWVGTTVENQQSVEARLPYLADIPAAVRFVSAEPLIGPLDLRAHLGSTIDWVITGGESGPKARPSSPSWFRELLGQCMAKRVPFHFKQWGDWAPGLNLDVRKLQSTVQKVDDGTVMLRVGKKAAGRLLDGETWNGSPEARAI